MAYKFQKGDAILSGSLRQEGNVEASASKISGSTIGITDVSGLVGNGIATGSTDSGTLEILLKGGAASGLAADAEGLFITSSGVTNDMLAGSIAADRINLGSGLFDNAGNITVSASQTTITSIINSGMTVIGTDPSQEYIDFSNANQIDFGINGNTELTVAAGSVTVAGNLTVQGTTTTVESQTLLVKDSLIELNVVTGSEGRSDNSGAGLFISGSTSGNDVSFTLNADGGRFVASDGLGVSAGQQYFIGNDQVLSDATLGSTVVSSSLQRVGALSAGSIASGFTAINVANVININSLDIDSGTELTDAADGHSMIIDSGSSGTNRRITLSNLKTYFQTGVTADSAATTDGFAFNQYETGSTTSANGVSGFWGINSGDGTAPSAVTFDLSGSWTNGNAVIVKAPSNAATNNLTVRANVGGGESIDGADEVVLESNNAAVTLIYGNGNWNIV